MAKSRKRSDTGTSAPSQTGSSAAATAEAPRTDEQGREESYEQGRGEQPDQRPSGLRMDETHRERVAQRAYELYLSRGGGHGSDWDDWLEAERELLNGQQTAEGSKRSGRHE